MILQGLRDKDVYMGGHAWVYTVSCEAILLLSKWYSSQHIYDISKETAQYTYNLEFEAL